MGVELLGIQDIARLYGWSRQRVYNYYVRKQLPEPYSLVGGKRPVWEREQIEAWKAGGRAKPPTKTQIKTFAKLLTSRNV